MNKPIRFPSAVLGFLVCFGLLFTSGTVAAQITLPKLVSDGMVLQRDVPVNIRGWASPGEKVSLSFRNKTFRAVTDKGGSWNISLPAQKAGGPWTMVFRGKNQVEVSDVLFGDVWICTGQSNMVLPMERVKEKVSGSDRQSE